MQTLSLTPYDYQSKGADHAARFLLSARPGDRLLMAAPTGTGKSVIELLTQQHAPGAWIVTPRVEIIAGLLAKLGHNPDSLSEAAMLALGETCAITTPIRLRNRLLAGEREAPPYLILDEGHHAAATTYKQLDALTGRCPVVGFTATPFRGTPRGTAAFREEWGDPVWILTMPEAITRGVLAFPACRIEPLIDDDLIEVQNGEFVASALTSATGSRLHDAAELVAGWMSEKGYNRPTMVSLPTVEATRQFAAVLSSRAMRNVVVTGDTPRAERLAAFADCVDRKAILLQVAVVSEGVDLPIRRLLDMAPSISPVRWLQQLGRITRPVGPGEAPPEYVCCNRNLLRHAYLLEGCLPPAAYREATEAFNGPGKAASARVVGLEALGRLKPIALPLKDGLEGVCYSVSRVDGSRVTQYAVLAHPLREEALWASRVNIRRDDNTTAYSRWQRCEAPEGLAGYASVPPGPLSDKQRAWWKMDAGRYGLDPAAEVTRKNFAALPVLADLKRAI